MPEEQTGVTEETGEVQETEQTEVTEENSNENEGEESTEETSDKEAELPEWARKALEKVRREAADRRVALRDAQEALKNAKTPEEVAEATKGLTDQVAVLERQILVRDVADDFSLPKELAEVLKGDTKEELEAHAKTLAKFAVPQEEPENLRGGLNPSGDDQSFDPVAASRNARKRR